MRQIRRLALYSSWGERFFLFLPVEEHKNIHTIFFKMWENRSVPSRQKSYLIIYCYYSRFEVVFPASALSDGGGRRRRVANTPCTRAVPKQLADRGTTYATAAAALSGRGRCFSLLRRRHHRHRRHHYRLLTVISRRCLSTSSARRLPTTYDRHIIILLLLLLYSLEPK